MTLELLSSLGATPAQLPRPEVVEHQGEPQPSLCGGGFVSQGFFRTALPHPGDGSSMGGRGMESQQALGWKGP